MAMIGNVKVRLYEEARPCYVLKHGVMMRALFHRWGVRPCDDTKVNASERMARTVAIVEFENGTCGEFFANQVRFVDSKDRFAEYDWRVEK